MKEQPKANKKTHRLTTALFAVYLIAIGWILLFKMGVRFSYMEKRSLNFIPFNKASFFTGENILNVVVFVPLGIYAGVLFESWSFSKKLLFFFLLSLLVEGLQYILRVGAFDVTDLFTNTLGGVIGWGIFRAIERAFNNSERAEKFINLLAATGTILVVLLLVLLKMNLLPVRYR